jgi:hypothetical protein
MVLWDSGCSVESVTVQGDAIVPVVIFQSRPIQSPKLSRPLIRLTSREGNDFEGRRGLQPRSNELQSSKGDWVQRNRDFWLIIVGEEEQRRLSFVTERTTMLRRLNKFR